jgi:di/tricarboxylate transporter
MCSFLLQAILVDNSGVEVLKKRGLKVLRARVTKQSRLVGHTAAEVQFRENYKAAIVAVQQGGKNTVKPLSSLKFGVGDILVLQVSDDCPLLSPPVTTASSDQFGADENTLPNTTERLDVEVGSKDYDIASSSVVCKIVSICLVGKRKGFSY